jgi:L-arabinokinase
LRSIFFYISEHGFGHASRQIEVINALGAAASGFDIVVRTSAAPRLFDRTVRVPIHILPGPCDPGVVQVDSLRLDERATIQQAATFYATIDQRAAGEADLLRRHGAAFVVADVPPLACAAAAAAGVPAVVLANFTWDWIYERYAEHMRGAPHLLPAIRSAYRRAAAAWRLPMHGGFETVGAIVDLPFIARHARHQPQPVRRMLGLPPGPLVLVSFGGYGARGIVPARLDCLNAYGVVMTHEGGPTAAVPGVHAISEAAIYEHGLRYEDLVRAVDVVISKPGYGIISECVANDTALLYTARGRFAEYDVLVSELPRYLRCGYIDHEALFAGRWRGALDDLASAPAPSEQPATDGARVAAGMILQHL